MSTRKSNPHLARLIRDLRILAKEHEAPVWRAVAERLEGPLRNWAEVNLSRLGRHAPEGSTVVIPGKLLGSGELARAVTVAAFQSSAAARKKVEASGGKVVAIEVLARGNPKGTGVRIMG